MRVSARLTETSQTSRPEAVPSLSSEAVARPQVHWQRSESGPGGSTGTVLDINQSFIVKLQVSCGPRGRSPSRCPLWALRDRWIL